MRCSPLAILFDLDDINLERQTGNNQHCWKIACDTYAPQLGTASPIDLFEAIETLSPLVLG